MGRSIQCRVTCTHIDEGEVGYQCLYLANDFGFGGRIKRFQHDVEDRLFLGLLLKTNTYTHASMCWCVLLTSTASSAGAAAGAGAAAVGIAIS